MSECHKTGCSRIKTIERMIRIDGKNKKEVKRICLDCGRTTTTATMDYSPDYHVKDGSPQ